MQSHQSFKAIPYGLKEILKDLEINLFKADLFNQALERDTETEETERERESYVILDFFHLSRTTFFNALK